MARNPVQFQKGISLNAFLSLYGTEDQCFVEWSTETPRSVIIVSRPSTS